jgi:fibronectin type III domain protein
MVSVRRRVVIAGVASVCAVGALLLGSGPAGAAAPANVTGLTATPLSSSSVRLDWTNPTSTGFKGVHICRNAGTVAPTKTCTGVNVAKPTATYTDGFQLVPNTQYTYGVFAYNNSGQLSSGASVTVTTPQVPAPANVTGLTATPTASSVTLNWTNPTSANFAGVYICRAQGAVAPTTPCGGVTVASPGTSYVDSTNVLPNTQYTYSVFASTANGVTASGAHVTTTTLTGTGPAPVTGLTATPMSPTSVTLNWTNPTSANFAGVYICRAPGSVAPTLPCGGVTVASPGTSYVDSTSLSPGTQYTYSVWASTSSGVTSSGASVTVTTPQGSAPPNVTGLTATPNSSQSVTLNWTNPAAASFAGVYICRAPGAVAPTLPCGGVTVAAPGNSYLDEFQLIPDTQYTYTVFSSTASGVTSTGATVTVTTPA